MTLRVYQPDFDWFQRNRLMIAVSLLCVIIGVAIVLGSAYWARDQAQKAVRDRSVSTLNLVIENLRGELSKFIYMPKVLSSLENLPHALAAAGNPDTIGGLGEELEQIANTSGAKAIHLVDRDGHAIATSGGDPMAESHAFADEPYFRDALQGRLGRHFSVGTQSRERSYFFAHPVRTGKDIVGVIVIQVELDNLEPLWFSANSEILVVDEHGVVFLSSRPEWRSRSLLPLPEVTRAKLEDRYHQKIFDPLPFVDGLQGGFAQLDPLIAPSLSGTDNTVRTDFFVYERDMPDSGWRVLILADAHGVQRQVVISTLVAASILVIILLIAANIYQRRRRLIERMAIQ
jgi:two-component system C4-dicarboxylate transport sensor histidine kinase DctB